MRSRTRSRWAPGTILAAGAALAVLGLMRSPARAADHRDGPRVSQASVAPLDINDVYVFASPSNRNNTVVALTVGGAAVGIVGPPLFFPGSVYELRVSNDGDPLTDELVIQAVFSQPNGVGRQAYNLLAVNAATGRTTMLARGMTGRDVQLRGGGRARAGIFDDPFFFDLIAFNKFRAVVQIGDPPGTPAPVAARVAPFLEPNFPNNFFGNFNTLAIVVEVPRTRLQSSRNNPNLTIWARTLTPEGVQFDRMGNPAINTVVGFEQPLDGLPSIQDTFNSLTPVQDVGLRGAAAQRINLAFGLTDPQLTDLVNLLLPDVIGFNTTSRAGFPNGRRLADDVIDVELGLLTNNGLTSDRVVNDSVFSNRFPYLGPPLPRSAIRGAIRALSAEAESLRP
jgi:hypothetical protein